MNLLIFNLKMDDSDPVLGFAVDWVNTLASHFDEVFVLTLEQGPCDLPDNVTVMSLGKGKGIFKLKTLLKFYFLLFKICAKNKIGVCFSHMNQLFVTLAGPILKIKKIPIVLWYAHSHVGWILRLAVFFSKTIVSSSQSGFRISTNKLKIIGQGIDTDFFRPSYNNLGRLRFLVLGRITPVKNLEVIISALARLKKDVSDFQLKIVGAPVTTIDEIYQERLEELIESYDMKNQVEWCGGKPHVQVLDYFQNSSVMINCSDTGSLDKAVLEAMSCGLPVVTSNEAFAEIVEIIPKNNSDVLYLRLKKLIAMMPHERIQLGEKLRDLVIEFHDFNKLIGRLVQLINDAKVKQ